MSFELVGVRLVAENGDAYIATMAKADQATTGFGGTSAGVFKQMPGLADIATGALHKIGTVAVDAFFKAGQAAVGFFTDSISAAGDFEAGMNTFSAVAGGALDEAGLKTKDFRDLFLSLGKELPVSTAEVQNAATEMIKGGIDPATLAAGGLKQNIQFAAAAMKGDLAGAATVSAKILGGWAEQGATAEEKAKLLTTATDLLTKAANASTVDVKELALGLYNVQGTAKTTGLSLEETATALAELSPRFASSSEAGTSFKNFLVRLQPTTKPAIAAMESLGLYTKETGSAFFDANGEFVGVAKASQLLHDKLEGLTDAQRVSLLQTMFGNDAMNAAAAFAESGAKGFDDMATSMAKANGVQANAATMQQGYNVALDNFHGSIEALQITIGSVFLPILTQLFNNFLAPGINTLTDLAAALSGDSDAFANLSPILQGVVGWFGSLSSGTGSLSDLWANTLLPVITAAGAYFDQSIAPILSDLGAVVLPLLSAAVQVAGGLWTDVLVPAIKFAWDAFNTLILPIIKDVTGWLAKNLPPAIQATADFFTGTLLPAIHDIYDFLDANIIPIFKDVVTWLEKNIPPAAQKAADFWNTVLWPALDRVWQFIQNNIIPIVQSVVGTLFPKLNTATAGVAGFWNDTLWPALNKVWTFLNTYVIPIVGALVNVWFALMEAEIKILANLWNNTLSPALSTAYDWLDKNIGPAVTAITGFFGAMGDKITKDLGPAIKWLNDNVLSPMADWFGTIGTAVNNLVGWLNDLADTIRNLPSMPSSYTGNSPPPMANWMHSIAGGTASAAGAMTMLRNSIQAMPASPMALMAGSTSNSATYNQQRNVSLNYHTQYAPPVEHSLAMATALAG